MERLKVAKEILKVAADLMFADTEYIYDPDHKKHPGGGYHKTEKGWSKLEEKKDESNSNKKPAVKEDDGDSNEIPSLNDVEPMNEQEQHDYEQASYGDWTVRAFMAEQANHPKILDKMSEDRSYTVVATVAQNHNTHPSTLEKLSNNPESYIRKCVAENPNTHIKTLEKLSKDSDEKVRNSAKESIKDRKKEKQIKSNPVEEPDEMDLHYRKPANEAYNDAVFSKDKKELDDLSNHSHFRVRESVAGNENTSKSTLRKLSSDEHTSVRAAVARNPKTPKDVLEKLSKDKEEYVSSNAKQNLSNRKFNAVIRNPNTSSKTLDKLADAAMGKHGDSGKMQDIAKHPNTSTETLDKMFSWHENDRKSFGEKNQGWSGWYVVDKKLMRNIASNPNTSMETLGKLSNYKYDELGESPQNNIRTIALNTMKNKIFDISKLSPEMREKVKDWDAEDIAKFLGWLKEHKGE